MHITVLHTSHTPWAACAALNFAKRYQQADLRDMVVLVTGARVKIGAPPRLATRPDERTSGVNQILREIRRLYPHTSLHPPPPLLSGYQICLKLLRSGATVVATSRFPRNTAARYACEPDFGDWSPRLHVYGIDLRIIADIDGLVETITSR